MTNTLKLVLTDKCFEEIKSGRKNHEYRLFNNFWFKRIGCFHSHFYLLHTGSWPELEGRKIFVQFQKAYRKNPERMTFEIKDIHIAGGEDTDLKVKENVFDIELGERVR